MRLNCRPLAIFAVLAWGAISFAQVTVHSLLGEMVDLTRLSERPNPAYTMAQASSFDRKSVSPGLDTWFANGDHGQYIRSDTHSGRKEYVMADLNGPGAVVRIWSANPSGTIRFYFDGEANPRMTLVMADLLSGNLQPYADPFAYIAGEGDNLYFPFPYAKSLKITVSGGSVNGLYYQVGYRTYAAGTSVTTYVPGTVTPSELSLVSSALYNPALRPMNSQLRMTVNAPVTTSGIVSRLAPAEIDLQGPGAVYELDVKVDPPTVPVGAGWTDPNQMQNVLRNLVLDATFDGEHCVEAPLGDFFGTAPGINPFEAFPMSVEPDSTLICRFVMPYSSTASFVIRNLSATVMPNVTLSATPGLYAFDSGSYHFHTQWTFDQQPTRPLRDINLLTAQGEGLWVGDNLHVANQVQPWWGEGDEKVWVDGDSFPSTFGTGTEDYFGYGWCCPDLFAKPYHGQSRSDPHAGYGNNNVHRWQILDPIPYKQSLNFNIEAYSDSASGSPTFAHTSYWYALPGGQPIKTVDPATVLPPQIVFPSSLAGTLVEAETMNIASVSNGSVAVLNHQASALDYRQLNWHGAQTGDSLKFNVSVPAAGKYRWYMRPTHGPNKPIVHVFVNGRDMGTFDLYSSSTSLSQTTLTPDLTLPAGNAVLEFDITGKNPLSTDYDFILDYVQIKKL